MGGRGGMEGDRLRKLSGFSRGLSITSGQIITYQSGQLELNMHV